MFIEEIEEGWGRESMREKHHSDQGLNCNLGMCP